MSAIKSKTTIALVIVLVVVGAIAFYSLVVSPSGVAKLDEQTEADLRGAAGDVPQHADLARYLAEHNADQLTNDEIAKLITDFQRQREAEETAPSRSSREPIKSD